MFDGRARILIDPLLGWIAERLKSKNVTPDQVTIAGFCLGLLAALAISQSWFLAGLGLILLSRLADGLDGSLARITRSSDFGGYLDIVLDFGFYGVVPLAFIFADPAQNALVGAVLIFSFYLNGASFLAYATLAEKRGLSTESRGTKAIYFTTGLAEATETLAVFVLACIFPHWFPAFAGVFATLCFYTALARIVQAKALFTE